MLLTNCICLNLFYFRNRIECFLEFREKGSFSRAVTLAILGALEIHYESFTLE